MNRDEKLTRPTALPPARRRLDRRDAILPSEPNAGTWIGVNDAGATLALINWYSVPIRVTAGPITRGEIVRLARAGDSPVAVDEILARFPLHRVNPFRLIGVFLDDKAVLERRWNCRRLERLHHEWQTNTWISSGFDETGAQQKRGRAFGDALRQESAGTADWLRRLHRSHGRGPSPYSTCMHRHDAATVSYTEVTVSGRGATLRYTPGPPCCTPSISDSRLPLHR